MALEVVGFVTINAHDDKTNVSQKRRKNMITAHVGTQKVNIYLAECLLVTEIWRIMYLWVPCHHVSIIRRTLPTCKHTCNIIDY